MLTGMPGQLLEDHTQGQDVNMPIKQYLNK